MKHSLRITLVLVVLFFLSQLIGLAVLDGYLGEEEYVVGGEVFTNVTWEELPYGVERPEFEEKTSFLPMLGIILVATLLVLIIMKFKFIRLWKVWFFLSVWFCLTVALKVFFLEQIALVLGAAFAFGKVWWRNIVLHNLTELLIYGGLAVVFVPFLSLFSVSLLLILISIYDFIAVRKTKHMVSMAKFQTKMKLFAGFLIPYGKKSAILGGGDIGFPLMFAGVVLKNSGWFDGVIVSLCVTLSLLYLLLKSEKNKFYPAMPFLTVGCFLGWILISWF